MKTTLFYWVFTRAPYHFIGTLFFAAWAYASGGPWGIGTGVFLTLVHGLIWYKEHQHRERVRGLIQRHIERAEEEWRDNGRWWIEEFDNLTVNTYGIKRMSALMDAKRRPDLWGEWTLNVYNGPEVEGVKPAPFATGNNDLWPRWVFEPVKPNT